MTRTIRKVTFLVLLTAGSWSRLLSQGFLTNGQVYDFSVGDVMQTRSSSTPPLSPPIYEAKHIIGKAWSANNDTIFYTIRRDNYKPPSCPTCQPFFSTDTIVQAFTHLSDSARHFNLTACNPLSDTLISSYCGRTAWEKNPVSDTSCIHGFWHVTRLVEGLGGPYGWFLDPTGGPVIMGEHALIYYYKYPDSCGTIVTHSGQAHLFQANVELSPNPAEGQVNIYSSLPCRSVILLDLAGRRCYSSAITAGRFDIFHLKSGTYVAVLDFGVKGKAYRKIVKW